MCVVVYMCSSIHVLYTTHKSIYHTYDGIVHFRESLPGGDGGSGRKGEEIQKF